MSLLLDSVLDSIANMIENTLGRAFYFLPQLVYFLASCLLSLLDLFQVVFRKIAGLDYYYLNADYNNPVKGDLIMQLIDKVFLGNNTEYSVVATAFWSITILGCILLFITTIAAIIRNEYTPDKDKKNSKEGIVKNLFKSIASFVIIPITCYFGIFLGNAVLQAVDAATSPSTVSVVTEIDDYVQTAENTDSYGRTKKTKTFYCMFGISVPTTYTPISGIIYRATMYNANRVRSTEGFYEKVIQIENQSSDYTTNFNIFNKMYSKEKSADAIDDAFMMGVKLKNPAILDNATNDYDNCLFDTFTNYSKIENFDITNVGLVSYYYNLWYFNLPVAFVMLFIVVKLFCDLILGLMQRTIELMGLLIISPIVISIMPISDGAFSQWRAFFITKLIQVYSCVFAMNVFFIINPIFASISMFGKGAIYVVLDLLVQSLFIVAGILSVKKLDESLAEMFKIGKVSSSLSKSGAEMFAATSAAVVNPRTIGAVKGTAALVSGVTGAALGGLKFAAGGLKAAGNVAAGGLRKTGYLAQKISSANKERRDIKRNNTQARDGYVNKHAGKGVYSMLMTNDANRNSFSNVKSRLKTENGKDPTEKDYKAYYNAHKNDMSMKDLSYKDWKGMEDNSKFLENAKSRYSHKDYQNDIGKKFLKSAPSSSVEGMQLYNKNQATRNAAQAKRDNITAKSRAQMEAARQKASNRIAATKKSVKPFLKYGQKSLGNAMDSFSSAFTPDAVKKFNNESKKGK